MLTAIKKISVQDIFRLDSNVPRRGLIFSYAFLPALFCTSLKLADFWFFFLIQNVTRSGRFRILWSECQYFGALKELLISKINNVKLLLSFFSMRRILFESHHYNNILFMKWRGAKKTIGAFMIIASFTALKRAREGI